VRREAVTIPAKMKSCPNCLLEERTEGIRAPGGRDTLSCENRPMLCYARAGVVPKRKETDTQSNLPFSRLPDTRRTLEIQCGNCGARFIAFYGTEEDAATPIVDTEKCGLLSLWRQPLQPHPRQDPSS
jgi:hypothetical protein